MQGVYQVASGRYNIKFQKKMTKYLLESKVFFSVLKYMYEHCGKTKNISITCFSVPPVQ